VVTPEVGDIALIWIVGQYLPIDTASTYDSALHSLH
jgi:hypothetical protein